LETRAFDVAVVDLDHTEIVLGLESIRRVMPDRYLPIMGVGEAEVAGVDLRMSDVPHPTQALVRLEHLMRAAVAEEEFLLRCQTFADHDATLRRVEDDRQPITILAIGAADERFLALSNSLMAGGVEVVAAPTPYTAFDYLHERAFDAAVLWGGENRSVAMSIASGMKRNTRLYHIPLVLYLKPGDEVNLSDLYLRGFADVVETQVGEADTAERIMALAHNYRRRVSIRRALDSVRVSHLTDGVTGLFLAEPFASHLGRVYAASARRRRTMALCVLRVAKSDTLSAINRGGWVDRALPQVGAMISRLVRVEDTAACLSSDSFAIMMPATTGAAARQAAERIAAVIACTAFEAGEDRSPFVFDFDIGVAEMTQGEGPIQLLERAVADVKRSEAA
jgi:two-component system cell cycle response regulator PopA